MKSRLKFIPLAGALLLVLAACGGGGDTGPLPPSVAAPTGLTAVPHDAAVTLAWDASTSDDVVRYTILQAEASGNYIQIADVDADTLSYRVTGLTNGTEYTFMVDARNAAGAGSSSDPVQATPMAAGPGAGSQPIVRSHSPDDGATDIGINSNISVTFSKPMNEASAEAAFSADPSVTCAFAWNPQGTRLTCDPATELDHNQAYEVSVDTGAQDLAGNQLAAAVTFSFTTGAIEAQVCEFDESSFGSCIFGP